MPASDYASLDSLVIRLLEYSKSGKLHYNEVKTLVAKLPAAAAEVRGIQKERTEPCTCGLAEEVARPQKNLQIYIDNGPNSKKGNQQKLYKMENQRLTSVVTEQKKQINGLLTKIKRQDSEIERLRRKSGEAENAQPVVPVARQPSTSSEHVTFADPAGHAAPRGNQRECTRH